MVLPNEIISNICSIISVMFYSIVYYPQFYEIYKTKCTDGISIWMLLLWSQADLLSLYSTIFLGLQINLVIIGWYHAFVGLLMALCTLYYESIDISDRRGNFEKINMNLIFIIFYFINLTIGIFLTIKTPYNVYIGSVIAWITSILYILGRVPQIKLNIERRSTEGLSMLMYVFTICGNSFYFLTVITYSTEMSYILLNLPWLIMSIITISMDLFVIYQSYMYNRLSTLNYFEH
jgi:uncharacterized protein with PQ loop repeat